MFAAFLQTALQCTGDVAYLNFVGQQCNAVVQLMKVGRALARHSGQRVCRRVPESQRLPTVAAIKT